MAYFFTADTHFGHRSMLILCGRMQQFRSVSQMDKTMIRNWNQTVASEDTVFICGDFAYRNSRPAASYLKQLNGTKIFIRGNHDQWLDEMTPDEKRLHFQLILQDNCVADLNGFRIGLVHKPTDADRFPVPVHLIVCGHIHNNHSGDDHRAFMNAPNMLNCGVDVNGFRPINLRELIANNERFYGRKYTFPEELVHAFE